MDVQLIDFAHPSEIRTFTKDGRHGRRDRDQRAGEEVDHDG
jgi:hypothetical protein